MKSSVYTATVGSVVLEGDERFKSANPEGLPFMVWRVRYSIRDEASIWNHELALSGYGILVTGKDSVLQRYQTCPFRELPPKIKARILKDLNLSRHQHGKIVD